MRLQCIFLLALLASCAGAPEPDPQAQANAATLTACRQRADEIFERQNRPALYSPPPNINVPSSGAFAPGVTNRGLADQFTRQNMIRDCVRNTGTETNRGAEQGVRNTP